MASETMRTAIHAMLLDYAGVTLQPLAPNFEQDFALPVLATTLWFVVYNIFVRRASAHLGLARASAPFRKFADAT